MNYTIQRADNFQAHAVTELLNRVTLDLLRKGIHQWEYPWDLEAIRKETEDGHVYIVLTDDKIIATFSVRERMEDEKAALYLYRIAVLPEFHGQKTGNYIISYAFQLSDSAKSPLYLDCWAGNSKLKSFYMQAGLEYLGDFPEKEHEVSVFRHDA